MKVFAYSQIVIHIRWETGRERREGRVEREIREGGEERREEGLLHVQQLTPF